VPCQDRQSAPAGTAARGRVEAVPFGSPTSVTMLTLSWTLFVINVAIQYI
jgi:hypothetical protein